VSKISIEQWRMFVAVVDCGGFAQAGDALYKTQSTVSHGIKKLENTLNKTLFDLSGRKATLTPFGASLLNSARLLVGQADILEKEAITQKREVNPTISIAVDTLYPRAELFSALQRFGLSHPDLNIQLYETVLSRCGELLDDGSVDIGIASRIPKGYLTQLALTVDLFAVVHVEHPLAKRTGIELKELENYRQVVVRDAGLRSNFNSGWLGTNTRITVSSMHEAIAAVRANLGFAWIPKSYFSDNDFLNNLGITYLQLALGETRTVALQCGVRPQIAELNWAKELQNLLVVAVSK